LNAPRGEQNDERPPAILEIRYDVGGERGEPGAGAKNTRKT
jgi:hypothetical protein